MKFSCASFTHTPIKNIVVLETKRALTFLFQTVSKANVLGCLMRRVELVFGGCFMIKGNVALGFVACFYASIPAV